MKLSDYLDINELAELIMDGKISVRDHDDDPDLSSSTTRRRLRLRISGQTPSGSAGG